jgi:hypothetical protein
MPTYQQAHVSAPSLNIYWRRFEFRPQIYTFPFLFLLHPQITETSTVGADKARCNLLTADVNNAHLDECTGQDGFLLTNPLHQHLLSRLTCPLLLAFLLVNMDNRRSRGVNITTLPSEILETMAANVVKTSPTPLDNIVSLHCS